MLFLKRIYEVIKVHISSSFDDRLYLKILFTLLTEQIIRIFKCHISTYDNTIIQYNSI